ncbi:hypothetical protein GCM10011534_16570 [Pseudooceanicola nanhaiensis]|uniref:Uncharacterized protein n=1 Tax=Pseudooceanicola nanhaiensis TaxID=375761 RepID=A0A917SSC8_9RHOB|nr:hypothetical protein GCM10011534_16570 [Pseudooceanicola nanhaiensis]
MPKVYSSAPACGAAVASAAAAVIDSMMRFMVVLPDTRAGTGWLTLLGAPTPRRMRRFMTQRKRRAARLATLPRPGHSGREGITHMRYLPLHGAGAGSAWLGQGGAA